jgi:WD40 repeat protein
MKIKIDEGSLLFPVYFPTFFCLLFCMLVILPLSNLSPFLYFCSCAKPLHDLGCKWISSMTLHPSGDHLLLGTYDRRVIWFDLDLSSMPYKTLKYHGRAVRQVAYHPRYPLMASASDDGCIHIIHSMVYRYLPSNSPQLHTHTRLFLFMSLLLFMLPLYDRQRLFLLFTI